MTNLTRTPLKPKKPVSAARRIPGGVPAGSQFARKDQAEASDTLDLHQHGGVRTSDNTAHDDPWAGGPPEPAYDTFGEMAEYLTGHYGTQKASAFLNSYQSIRNPGGRVLFLQDSAVRLGLGDHRYRVQRDSDHGTRRPYAAATVDPSICAQLGELGYSQADELKDLDAEGIRFVLDNRIRSERLRLLGPSVVNRCGSGHGGRWLTQAALDAPDEVVARAAGDPRGPDVSLVEWTGAGRGDRMVQARKQAMCPVLYEAEHLSLARIADVRAATPRYVPDEDIIQLAEAGFDGAMLRRHGLAACRSHTPEQLRAGEAA